jgi:hypothetical protein
MWALEGTFTLYFLKWDIKTRAVSHQYLPENTSEARFKLNNLNTHIITETLLYVM